MAHGRWHAPSASGLPPCPPSSPAQPNPTHQHTTPPTTMPTDGILVSPEPLDMPDSEQLEQMRALYAQQQQLD